MIVDSFAGGGGASLGIEMALGYSPDIAINHDPIALAMFKWRIERLNSISFDDCRAEGHPVRDGLSQECTKRKDAIYAWDKNPWVSVTTFEPIFKNAMEIDNE